MSRIVIVALVMGSFGFGLTTYAWAQRRGIPQPMVLNPQPNMMPNPVSPNLLPPQQPQMSSPVPSPQVEQQLRDDLREQEIRSRSLRERLPPGSPQSMDLGRSLSEAQRQLDDYHLKAQGSDAIIRQQGVTDAMRDLDRKRAAAEQAAAGR